MSPGFSEDELVAALRKVLSGEAPGVRIGIGDDAAVVEPGSGDLVLTADALIEGVHFERDSLAARDLGYKAIVVNVSDVAAMAASPRFALVTLGLSAGTDVPWVVELYGGMRTACEEYAVSLVGGDLSRSAEIVVAVTVTGVVAAGREVRRSGAKPGQRLVVTGSLGAAAGGIELSKAADKRVLATDWGRGLLHAHSRPVARVGEAQVLAAHGTSAMIDISDGLAKDLSRLCAESGAGARLSLAAVPIARELGDLARTIPVNPLELALSGGEDYELLATLDANEVAGATEDLKERFGVALTDVGEVSEKGLVAVLPDGTERPLEPRGWDHFAG